MSGKIEFFKEYRVYFIHRLEYVKTIHHSFRRVKLIYKHELMKTVSLASTCDIINKRNSFTNENMAKRPGLSMDTFLLRATICLCVEQVHLNLIIHRL